MFLSDVIDDLTAVVQDLLGDSPQDRRLTDAFTPPCTRQRLIEGQQLSGRDLRGANLEKANLRNAHLEGAHLEGARMWG